MPRVSKGPRLWKRPARRKDGKIIGSAVWVIKDGGRHIATGCIARPTGTRPPAEAEQALADYIANKYTPVRRERNVDVIDIADVLSIYRDDKRGAFETEALKRKFDNRIARLNEFFGDKKLGQMSTQLCNEYVKQRGSPGGARRDLEDLRSAINHHARENLHHAVIHVALPAKGPARERWLTRSEAAKLIWTCWRHREVQRRHRGKDKGKKLATDKRPLKHLARFFLIGVYTGTRAGAIASASPVSAVGRSHVDLARGIFYRLAKGKKKTNKRQPPAPIPTRLLAHMRRWHRLNPDAEHFVEFNGKPVRSVKTAFKRAVTLSKISLAEGPVSPHTLRHTAATWLMQRGADPWQAAGYLGMSVKVLIDTYGHHHPDYMKEAADAITSKDRTKNVSVVETVVELNQRHARIRKT